MSSLDFFYSGDRKHARLSLYKAAELLEVDRASLTRLLKNVAPESGLCRETIAVEGVDGVALVKLAKYYSTTRQVSSEVRSHNIELLEKMAIIGSQLFINRLAKIEDELPPPPPKPLPTPLEKIEAVNQLANSLTVFGFDIENPRFKEGLHDLIGDALGLTPNQPRLPGDGGVWCGVAERAEQLGYAPGMVAARRVSLGMFVAKRGLESQKEKRLCNKTQRPINVYKVTADFDSAIHTYFESVESVGYSAVKNGSR